jgi:hypothetical protein
MAHRIIGLAGWSGARRTTLFTRLTPALLRDLAQKEYAIPDSRRRNVA